MHCHESCTQARQKRRRHSNDRETPTILGAPVLEIVGLLSRPGLGSTSFIDTSNTNIIPILTSLWISNAIISIFKAIESSLHLRQSSWTHTSSSYIVEVRPEIHFAEMLSSLLNASPVAPKVTPRPSASPKKVSGSLKTPEGPGLEDDDDVVYVEVSQLSSLPPS